MKLDAARFGLAMGIVYAAVFFLYGVVAALTGLGAEMMRLIGGFYVGAGPSLGGAVIGALWGFAIGLVFFWAGAWIYNRLLESR